MRLSFPQIRVKKMWKVMAADDEAYIREALYKLISWEKMDCRLCAVCGNGRELLMKMEEERPDIIITDIRMPVMDGLEVCRYVYETCPETQVILLTAYSEFEYAKKAVSYGACEYVLKVSVLEELPKAVQKAVEKLRRSHEETAGKNAGTETMVTLYKQVEQYIEQNYTKRISLDEIAGDLHANRSYLSRLYKEKTGMNLFDVILKKRIEAAKDLLLNTEMKTYEISDAVGFDNAGYFSKVFKKQTGVSPKEFRNGKRNGMEEA